MAEAEEGLDAKAVKPAVAHIEALGVVFLFQVAVAGPEGIGAGVVGVAFGPGGGELALRYGLAQQDVGHGLAALLPRLGDLQNSQGMAVFRQQVGEFHRAPGVEDQYQGQARFVQGAQVGGFPLAEQVVPRRGGAVLALAGDAAEHIDCHGGSHQIRHGHRTALGQYKGVGRIGVKGIFHLGGIVQDLVLPGQACPVIEGFVVVDPIFAGQVDPGGPEPFINGNVGPVIHISRTDTAFDGAPGTGTQQGYRCVGV